MMPMKHARVCTAQCLFFKLFALATPVKKCISRLTPHRAIVHAAHAMARPAYLGSFEPLSAGMQFAPPLSQNSSSTATNSVPAREHHSSNRGLTCGHCTT